MSKKQKEKMQRDKLRNEKAAILAERQDEDKEKSPVKEKTEKELKEEQ